MKFSEPLVRGTLLKRYKRFLSDIQLPDGDVVVAHCANPGAMLGLNEAGADGGMVVDDEHADHRPLRSRPAAAPPIGADTHLARGHAPPRIRALRGRGGSRSG